MVRLAARAVLHRRAVGHLAGRRRRCAAHGHDPDERAQRADSDAPQSHAAHRGVALPPEANVNWLGFDLACATRSFTDFHGDDMRTTSRCDDHVVCATGARSFASVIWNLRKQRRSKHMGQGERPEGISNGRGFDKRMPSNRAERLGAVVDHDGLAEAPGHRLQDNPCSDGRRGACRTADETNRLVWIAGRRSARGRSSPARLSTSAIHPIPRSHFSGPIDPHTSFDLVDCCGIAAVECVCRGYQTTRP